MNVDGSVCAHGSEEAKSCVYNEYGVLVGGFCLRAFIVLGAVLYILTPIFWYCSSA